MRVERLYREKVCSSYGYNDTIDNLPLRRGIHYMDILKRTSSNRFKDEKRYRHYCGSWEIVGTMLQGSIGRHIDRVFSDVCHRMNGMNTKYSPLEMINRHIRFSLYSVWRTTNTYYNIIDRYTYGIYIDEKGFIREKKRPIEKKGPPNNINYGLVRRTEEKERRRQGLIAIRMINNPQLLQFYTGLLRSKKQYTDSIEENTIRLKEAIEKAKKKYKKWDNSYYVSMYNRKIEECRKELKKIIPQIQSLEIGEYGIFFESATYLYSITKECHHFDNR